MDTVLREWLSTNDALLLLFCLSRDFPFQSQFPSTSSLFIASSFLCFLYFSVLLPRFVSNSLLALRLLYVVCLYWHQVVAIFSSGLLMFATHTFLTRYECQWLHPQNRQFRRLQAWKFPSLVKTEIQWVENNSIQRAYPWTRKPVPLPHPFSIR